MKTKTKVTDKPPRVFLPAEPELPFTPELLASKDDDYLLVPREVASLFRVDPKTVNRWDNAGKIDGVRTPGGHRRFPVPAVRRALKKSLDGAGA